MLRIAACLSGDSPEYAELARVWYYSARRHNPGASVELRQSTRGPIDRYPAFVQKIHDWCDVVNRSVEGDCVILCDADTLVLRPLADAFAHHFNFAVTTRRSRHDPINSGVVFVRVCRATRNFMALWQMTTARMVVRERRSRDRPMSDQDALLRLWQRCADDIEPWSFPCVEWNCEQTSWHSLGSSTRILHLKSDARDHVFRGASLKSPGADRAVAIWREYQTLANQESHP